MIMVLMAIIEISIVLKHMQNIEDQEDFIQYMDIKQMEARFIGHIHIIMIGFGL